LSDINHKGSLDNEEFAVAMHLINKYQIQPTLPSKLPPNLIPPSKRQGKQKKKKNFFSLFLFHYSNFISFSSWN